MARGACKPCPRRFTASQRLPSSLSSHTSPFPSASQLRPMLSVPFVMTVDVIRPSRSLPRSPREAGTQLSFRESY